MLNSKTILFIVWLMSSLIFIGYLSDSVNAISSDLLDDKHVFGSLVGITVSETWKVDWVITGTWRSILTNDTFNNTNEKVIQNNKSSGGFKASIEMIKPDGTGRHTHALTDFVVLNTTSTDNGNYTNYNGTSTISLRDGPAVDVPTTIQKSNNDSVFMIKINPESVDYHFGNSSLYMALVSIQKL
jgi:hypothetical protein